MVYSHGSSHERSYGFIEPCHDVDIGKITADDFGRCIVAETIIDGSKIALVNIYAPNDATQQVVFLRDVSKEFLIPYANDNLVLGGDFNCTISTLDKKGGRPIDNKKASLNELQSLIKTHNLLDSWRFKNPDQPGFTWANPSMKIQCRLDYFSAWSLVLRYFKAAKRSLKRVQNTSKHLFRSLRRRGSLTTLCCQILIM